MMSRSLASFCKSPLQMTIAAESESISSHDFCNTPCDWSHLLHDWYVCVYVCVCVRERESLRALRKVLSTFIFAAIAIAAMVVGNAK